MAECIHDWTYQWHEDGRAIVWELFCAHCLRTVPVDALAHDTMTFLLVRMVLP